MKKKEQVAEPKPVIRELEEIETVPEEEQNVVFNEQILQEIDKMENYQNDLDYQLGVVGKKVTTLHGEIQVLKTKEKTINDNIDKVEELEDSHQAYQYLLEAIKRDGVPVSYTHLTLPTKA